MEKCSVLTLSLIILGMLSNRRYLISFYCLHSSTILNIFKWEPYENKKYFCNKVLNLMYLLCILSISRAYNIIDPELLIFGQVIN